MKLPNVLNDKKSYSSWLVVILLIFQVMLSSIIIIKLMTIEQRFSQFLGTSGQPEPTEYIANVSIDNDPQKGAKDGKIKIIEFADYQCPFCAQANATIDKVLETYKDKVLFVYRDFPLTIHQNAFQAAEAADCAGDQGKYWEMHDLLYNNQNNLDLKNLKEFALRLGLDSTRFNDCLDSEKFKSEVQYDLDDGIQYQVDSTPTFFVNGHRLKGPTYDQFQSIIEKLLNDSLK